MKRPLRFATSLTIALSFSLTMLCQGDEELTVESVSALLIEIENGLREKDFEKATQAFGEETQFVDLGYQGGKFAPEAKDFETAMEDAKAYFEMVGPAFDGKTTKRNLELKEDGEYVDAVIESEVLLDLEEVVLDMDVRHEYRVGLVEGELRILWQIITFLHVEKASEEIALRSE